MPKDKKEPDIEIRGDLTFNSLDVEVARFSMESHESIILGKRLDIPAALIQEAAGGKGFDPTVHEVTGKFSLEIDVKEKE